MNFRQLSLLVHEFLHELTVVVEYLRHGEEELGVTLYCAVLCEFTSGDVEELLPDFLDLVFGQFLKVAVNFGVIRVLGEVDDVTSDLFYIGNNLEKTELVFDNLGIKYEVTNILGH